MLKGYTVSLKYSWREFFLCAAGSSQITDQKDQYTNKCLFYENKVYKDLYTGILTGK